MVASAVQTGVPSPTTLLAIQTGGGVLALLPILSLNKFARLPASLHRFLITAAIANVLISALVLVAFVVQSQYVLNLLNQIGEIGLCRFAIFYDMIMLGGLVCLTGGSDQSVFAAQFAAILPMAILIPDLAAIKWAYAASFLLLFLLGLQKAGPFEDYLSNSSIRERWLLVFFFIFTIFPVVYSIQTERTIP